MTRLRRTARSQRKKSRRTLGILVATGLCTSGCLLFGLSKQVDRPHLPKSKLPVNPQSTPIPTQPPSPSPGPYNYTYPKQFDKPELNSPWKDWSKCDLQVAFEQQCHPRPATCTNVKKDVRNNHGIGNALIVTYLRVAKESLQEAPDCAPIIQDKLTKPEALYNFRFLDYIQEPTVVVPIAQGPRSEHTQKCLVYSITQPRPVVAAQVQTVHTKFQPYDHLPLVALHLRTGWSDELQRNAPAWQALGTCGDYPLGIQSAATAMSEVHLTGLLEDTARAAHQLFGQRQWRLYVASDAPGIRRYVHHWLKEQTVAVVWNSGRVGHNYLGGQDTTTRKEKRETSVSAFTDVLVMSQADLLVSLSSKFPRAAELRTSCPQRTVHLPGHPRHGLAKLGGLLSKAWKQTKDLQNNDPWVPQLASDEAWSQFYEALPMGRDNPCLVAPDPVRSCFCRIKLGHAERSEETKN